jgi:hypothetical protein
MEMPIFHHFRIGQFEIVHQRYVLLNRLDPQARIECLLLANGADRLAFVVVGRVDQCLVGQFQEPIEDRFILRAWIPILEIGATGATDEQRIAGENPVRHGEGVGIVGVPRSVDDAEG